jgi:hypothetical protein
MSEAAIIALAQMGREIAVTIRVAIENQDPVLRDRFLEATKPLHEMIVRMNKAAASLVP